MWVGEGWWECLYMWAGEGVIGGGGGVEEEGGDEVKSIVSCIA